MPEKSSLRLPRLYPILDTATLDRCGCAVMDAAEGLLEAGVGILQFRHKAHYSRRVFEEAERVGSLCRDAGVLFVVNDRADIAMLLDAALHLGQDDLAPAAARRLIGHARVLGFSTHNEDQLRAALGEPADYLAMGPVFSTGSKANADPVVGVDLLRSLRAIVDRPLVAIGGISLERAPSVYEVGADSIAVIGALFDGVNGKAGVRMRAEEWLRIR